jgi:acyl-CoA synthetase (AMP-forming)/AMP-acid ligase II
VVRERAASRAHIVAPADVAERVALAPAPGEAPLPAPNAAALLRRNGTDPEFAFRPALHFGERTWTHAEVYAESTRYAALFLERLDPSRPPHVGVLLDNTPEYVFCLLGAGLIGAAVVGLNHTRRDEHLVADIGYTDVQLLVTEPRHQGLLAPVVGDLALPGGLLVSERFADVADPPRTMGETRGHPAPATRASTPTSRRCGCCCSPRAPRPRPRPCGARSGGCSPPATA